MSEPESQVNDNLALYMSFVAINLLLVPQPYKVIISIILLILVIKNVKELRKQDKQRRKKRDDIINQLLSDQNRKE